MMTVRKVLIPEDVYRVLVSAKNDLNDVFIRRFRCTGELIGPGASAPSAPVKVYEKWIQGGPLISVWQDDLTRQDTDVVVNAANERLDHVGGLALALVKAGGQRIVQESQDHIARKKGFLTAGDIAVTSAGTLPSKAIVHAVGPVWLEASPDKCKAQLQDAISKVLQYVSDHSDLHSVAIPAVSSGIFGFPLHLCANIIVSTVRTFCNGGGKAHLKEVRLVNNDDKTVQAMRTACEQILGSSDTPSRAPSSSHPAPTAPWEKEASSQSTSSNNGLNLHLKTGWIEDEQTDIIVNSVSSDLVLSSGAISAAIYNRAGPQLQEEIRKKRNRNCNMIVTVGCRLRCRYVYHVILPPNDTRQAEKTLREVTKDCLATAQRYGSPSISFPALGTGNIGLQKHKVADIMTQTVHDFARAKQSKMDVYFVIHPNDEETFKAFQDKMRASGIITQKNTEFTGKQKGLESSVDEMCVSIAGLCSEDVEEAAAWLQGLLSSSSPLLLHNNHLLLFGSKEFDVLASGPPSVDIEEEVGDGRSTLKISGPQPGRVMAAVQAERLLLGAQDEFAVSLEEELLEAAVIWFYESQSESHRYPAKANMELEKAYGSRTNVTLRAAPGHVINIATLTAQDGERKFNIRRRCLRVPSQNMQTSRVPEQSQTKQVDPNSQEFKDRSKEFKKASFILEKMEKVQNKLLSTVFQYKKEEVEQRQKKPSTEQLYQLVPGQFCKKICDVGFHRLYAIPRETKYGSGVYFKKNLHNIRERFFVPEKDGLLSILQAEVVIGATTKYGRTQPALPCVGSDALPVFECLEEGARSPEHYVILDRFHANPQYVFTCRYKP